MRNKAIFMLAISALLLSACTKPSAPTEKIAAPKSTPTTQKNIDANVIFDDHAVVTEVPPVCGNNFLDPGEACDGAALGICVQCDVDCKCAPIINTFLGGNGAPPRVRAIDECVIPKTGECETHNCSIFKIASSSGIDISVTEWGNKDGPPILFIHGFPWSYVTWIPQLTSPELAANFHLFTMDLRGFGLSDKPTGEFDYEASALWAADVKSVIDEISNGEPVVVVGHSYGSLAIADYISVYGDAALAGIVFVGGFIPSREDGNVDLFLDECFPPLFPGLFAQDIEQNVYNMLAFVELSSNLFVSQMLKDLHFGSGMMSTPFSREKTITRDFHTLPSPVVTYNDVLNSITKPVLIIHGEEDRVVEVRAADHYEDELINSVCVTKVIFDDHVGHTPHLEETTKFNTLLFNFAEDPESFCD